jgi:hypothetical protein
MSWADVFWPLRGEVHGGIGEVTSRAQPSEPGVGTERIFVLEASTDRQAQGGEGSVRIGFGR